MREELLQPRIVHILEAVLETVIQSFVQEPFQPSVHLFPLNAVKIELERSISANEMRARDFQMSVSPRQMGGEEAQRHPMQDVYSRKS